MNELPIEKYHKGWTDKAMFEAFCTAIDQGNCHDISRVVAAQGADRKPVDAYVKALRMPRGLSGTLPLPGEIQSPERKDELRLIIRLAELRDTPIEKISAELDDLPLGMTQLSGFLKDWMVPVYEPGKDYMTTKRSHESVMAGDAKKPIKSSDTTNIITLRDAAAYVHTDDPFELWGNVIDTLLELKVPQRLQDRINDSDGNGQSRFTVFGAPFLKGLIGYAILQSGPVSFRNKWLHKVPRPEQLAKDWLDEYLPVAYPEGSPMHPARPAMHSFVALVCASVLSRLFDTYTQLPTGRTVGEELALLADNVGYFRVFAGVHYPSDHDDARRITDEIAKSLVRPYLR